MPDIQLWQVNSVSPAVCRGYLTSCNSALRYHREILWLPVILIGRRLGFWIFRGHWNPARPLWFGRSWPDRNISLCLMCHRAKFSHSASNHKNVITEILQKIVTHHAAPFKVTQSPWNRHYLIDYLWIPIGVPHSMFAKFCHDLYSTSPFRQYHRNLVNQAKL